jgi:hypothetical protein
MTVCLRIACFQKQLNKVLVNQNRGSASDIHKLGIRFDFPELRLYRLVAMPLTVRKIFQKSAPPLELDWFGVAVLDPGKGRTFPDFPLV